MRHTPYYVAFLCLPLFISCENQMAFPAKSVASNQSKMQRIDGAIAFEFVRTVNPYTGTVPKHQLFQTWQSLKQLENRSARESVSDHFNWEERGPSDVGGRTRSVLFDLLDNTNNTVWAGSVSGGLWVSRNFQNANATWEKVDDFFDNLAVSALIQDPENPEVMYFGTGEGWFNEDAVRGMGIWKSTDGGESWTPLPSTHSQTFHHVMDLLIDRNGHVYAATRLGGIRKSEDGGMTWRQVLGVSLGNADSDRGADLELGADGDIYATLGFFSIGTVYKSDFGVSGAETGNRTTWTDITPEGEFQRIELATAPSDSNRLYLLCEGLEGGDVDHMFVSNSGGQSWDTIPIPTILDRGLHPRFTRGQAWYDLIAAVHPDNADLVYIAAVDALRSFDAGQTWEQISTWDLTEADGLFTEDHVVHADHHCIAFEPGKPSAIIFGTDGGLYYSGNIDTEGVQPTFAPKNNNYVTAQFYSCTISPLDGAKTVMGGTQDNGTMALWSQSSPSTGTEMFDADGGVVFFDPLDVNTLILARNNIDLAITGDFGANYDFVALKGGRFVNPMDYDAKSRVLHGAHKEDGYFFVDSIGMGNRVDSAVVPEFEQGLPSAIKVDPHGPNRIWVGLSRYWDPDRSMYFGGPGLVLLDNANSVNPTVQKIVIPTMPTDAYLSSIDVDPNDPQHLIITFSNYGVESVWESGDAGQSWSSVQGDLPDMPVRWAIFNPLDGKGAFLATEMGVWSTTQLDPGQREVTQWVPDNEGLANVRCDMIRYRASDNMFVVATHGRGLYISPLSFDSTTTAAIAIDKPAMASIYPNPAQDDIYIATQFQRERDAIVTLYDVMGRELLRQRMDFRPGQTLRLAIPNQASPGIHMISLRTSEGEIHQQKLWIQ